MLTEQAIAQGPFCRAAARQRPGLCGGGELDRAARHGRRPIALAADGDRRKRSAKRRALFFIHPTTYLERDRWNAPLDDTASQARADCSCAARRARSTASREIWAPRYRQAAFGAFLLDNPDANQALDLAYRDVLAAFDPFVADRRRRPADHPRRAQPGLASPDAAAARAVAGKPLEGPDRRRLCRRLADPAQADVPAIGLPACATADQAGCILSWQSFAEPANRSMVTDAMSGSTRPDRRQARARRTWSASTRSPAPRTARSPPSANPGTLVPTADLTQRRSVAGPGRRALRRRFPDHRRRDPAARPLCAARQQLSRLRLCPVLGRDPRRCRAEAGGVAARDRRQRQRNSRRRFPMRGKLAGLDVGTKTIGLAICDAGWHFAGPAETIRRTKFTADLAALAAFVERERSRAWSSACRSTSTAATARAPNRSAPSPATSRRSACRSCCGTSAGRPRRSSGR